MGNNATPKALIFRLPDSKPILYFSNTDDAFKIVNAINKQNSAAYTYGIHHIEESDHKYFSQLLQFEALDFLCQNNRPIGYIVRDIPEYSKIMELRF